MNKAIFLDRDGIINKEIGDYVYKLEEFEINEGVVEALKYWRSKGYKLIIITNQGGIAKGMYSHEDVHLLHQYLHTFLNQEGIHLDAIYYSPHHPDFGNSLSRKPGSLMIEKALARFDLDPKQSVMIGDRPRDIEAAEGAGVRGILVDANTDLRSLVERV
ncbi:MAG: HAD-IIIA family hydrolase [Bacteroidetes bacterium]|nr:HAD-IIIA family hydrolase [Bacteroidota bacterium]